MTEHENNGQEDATPAEFEAEERRIEALNAEILDFQRRGWTWNQAENLLIHPDDPDANIWIHPYSGEKLYSPRLVELLREQKDREEGVGEPVSLGG